MYFLNFNTLLYKYTPIKLIEGKMLGKRGRDKPRKTSVKQVCTDETMQR